MTTTETPIPQALVLMLPYGEAARLAAQVLARTDEIALIRRESPRGSRTADLLLNGAVYRDLAYVQDQCRHLARQIHSRGKQ